MKISPRLATTGLALILASTSAHSVEPTDREFVRTLQAGLDPYGSMSDMVQYSLDQIQGTAARFAEAQQLGDIAACVQRGHQVEVYLLYRRVQLGDGQSRDILQEVSPHPFPNFLQDSGTSFSVSRKYVVGNGAYAGLGAPPYPGAREFAPYMPGQSYMRAASDDRETARQYARWNLYKVAIDLWKDERFETTLFLQARAGDANKSLNSVFLPYPTATAKVREALLRLETQMNEIEDGVAALQWQFDLAVSARTLTTEEVQLKSELAALRAKLPLIRNYLDTVNGMGGASALTREDAGYYRVLHFLARELNGRAVAYENALRGLAQTRLAAAQTERDNVARRAYRKAQEEHYARRAAWRYLTAQAGAACEGPDALDSLEQSGRARGVQMSHSDFTSFFIEESTQTGYINKLKGDYRSDCQLTLLRAMLQRGQPIPIGGLLDLARQYRRDHPGFLKRVLREVRSFGDELQGFEEELSVALKSSGGSSRRTGNSSSYSSSSPSGNAGSGNTETDSSTGTYSTRGPNIDLRRRDFDQGPGSTLGR